MRPALGGDTAVIELQTTKPLRVLDFTRLQEPHGEGLSYFQPDFTAEVERRAFLLRLHTLISQPVVPGREADYLITQTMAEYLAHVHQEPFGGILFKSVQRAGGVNVVLFAEPRAPSRFSPLLPSRQLPLPARSTFLASSACLLLCCWGSWPASTAPRHLRFAAHPASPGLPCPRKHLGRSTS